MKLILLLCCSVLSIASKLCLDNGWVIQWELTETSIKFTLTIDEETFKTKDYIGLGYQTLDETDKMVGADIDTIIFKDQTVCDSYSRSNTIPDPDVNLEGKEDITNIIIDLLEFRWEKPLDTGDGILDHVFKKDDKIRLLWASGEFKDGVQMYHGKKYRGVEKITLTNDFISGCDSSFLELI